MAVAVRYDAIADYTWVDFYVDEANRWEETVTLWPGAEGVGSPTDLTGFDARFVVVRAGFGEDPVLDITGSPSPAGQIVIGGEAGTLSWDVEASVMAAFDRPVYQHELLLIPPEGVESSFSKIKGRVLVRASLIPEEV